MAKRFFSNQQPGERKKARLDISISDHNFPLSQNFNNKEAEQGNWGDDNDDEILLLASQACEQAYNDTSLLTDYSICMQPGSTSTQYEPTAGTSKSAFTFKKPSGNPPNSISTHLKNKISTISSPLPGMSTEVKPEQTGQVSLTDELVFNDKICKGQDPDFMYRQLLQLQEENAKLKSENGKLLEKCVTKEGESSILRTQLKSCQLSVDNARLEKIKAQEKVQLEWNEKLIAANNQMHDLRTQLDFKNLEIISIKEKCKKLESTKVKLTQVTVSNNDISSSHRINNNSLLPNEFSLQAKRAKVTSNGVQTDGRSHFLILNKINRKEIFNLSNILPLILETSQEQQYSIIDYNEKLQKHKDYAQSKCRILSTFHRVPSTPTPGGDSKRIKVNLSNIYEDLTLLVTEHRNVESINKSYIHIFDTIKSALQDVVSELEAISRRVTTAFQKEMDERYIEATSTFLIVNNKDLLKSGALYRDEQAIMARRMTATTAYIIENSISLNILKLYEEKFCKNDRFVDSINRICTLLDGTSCAVLYSGLLFSLIMFLGNYLKHSSDSRTKVMETIKVIIVSRPMPSVSCEILTPLRRLAELKDCFSAFCPGCYSANLKVDYDQGVLLYRKDSCHFQVLLKQVEASLKCIEKQAITGAALNTTRNLLAIYSNINDGNTSAGQERAKCDCQRVLMQIIVYGLRICAVMLKTAKETGADIESRELLAVCRSGVLVLYQCSVRDVEFSSQLSHNEGHLIDMCEIVKQYEHTEMYVNMLSELMGTFQASPEEISSFHRQPWLKSFESFSLTD